MKPLRLASHHFTARVHQQDTDFVPIVGMLHSFIYARLLTASTHSKQTASLREINIGTGKVRRAARGLRCCRWPDAKGDMEAASMRKPRAASVYIWYVCARGI